VREELAHLLRELGGEALVRGEIRVGRWTCWMVQAIVADLPEPVMPRRVWKRSPRSMPAASFSIAAG
jgi:hypothetical protein